MQAEATEHLLVEQVGDMLAQQNALLETIERQLGEMSAEGFPEAKQFLRKVEAVLQSHTIRLNRELSAMGDSFRTRAKETVTALASVASGVVDRFRTHPISKMLRDDYAALSLAAAGYTMLHTAALAFNDRTVADMAVLSLRNLTPLIVELSEILPVVVVNELAREGLEVDALAAPQAVSNLREAWSHETVGKAR